MSYMQNTRETMQRQCKCNTEEKPTGEAQHSSATIATIIAALGKIHEAAPIENGHQATN